MVRVRFGGFEVDLQSGDLQSLGLPPIRIQQLPLQVLRLLVEAEGRVVTREQLRSALWLEDTFVDFEHGVNTAIKKLRQALGDSYKSPKFIETLPKVGYRFLVPVESIADPVGQTDPGQLPIARIPAPRPVRKLLITFAAIVSICADGGLGSVALLQT